MGVNVSVGVNVIVGVNVSVGVNVTVGVNVSVGVIVTVLVGVNKEAVFVEDLAVAVMLYPGREVTINPIDKQTHVTPIIARPIMRIIFQVFDKFLPRSITAIILTFLAFTLTCVRTTPKLL